MPYGDQSMCTKIFDPRPYGAWGQPFCNNLGAEAPLPQNQAEIEDLKSIATQLGGSGFLAFHLNAKKDYASGQWVDHSGSLIDINVLSPYDTWSQTMYLYAWNGQNGGEAQDWTFGTSPREWSDNVLFKDICLKAPQLGKLTFLQ